MLNKSTAMAFIPTTDLEEAKAFYRDVLGLKLMGEKEFALLFDANGTRLRVTKVNELTPAPYTIVGWIVDDIRETVEELGGSGVSFERFEELDQDEAGIKTFQNGDMVAWFADPDGNMLSVTQWARSKGGK